MYLSLTSLLTSFLPLLNRNLTSASSSRISSHGLETTVSRPLAYYRQQVWQLACEGGEMHLIYLREKLRGNNQSAKSFHSFHTISHFFQKFSPRTLPFKTKVLAQSEQMRRKDKKNTWTNRCCTLVVARLSSSYYHNCATEAHHPKQTPRDTD